MTTFCTARNHASRGIYFYIVRIAIRTSAGFFIIQDDWSPEALAVVELLDDLREVPENQNSALMD